MSQYEREVPVGRTLTAARMTSEQAADETAQEQHERSRDMFFLRNGRDGEDLGQHDGITYEFQGWAETPWGTDAGRIVAYQGMSTIGSIEWIDGVISSVWVAYAHRRQGVATRLLEHARALTPGGVQHSTLLTEDGRAWAERVGSYGSVPGVVFEHEESRTGGSKWPVQHDLVAMLDGVEVGRLTYLTGTRANSKVLIDSLYVDGRFRRRGIGSALMDEMQRRRPGASIDHGDRTDDGKAWWAGYTRGRSVTRGRTMASLSGLTSSVMMRYVHEPSRSKYDGIVVTSPRMVAFDGQREVGSLDWDFRDPRLFGTVRVDPAYRGRGIATRLFEEAKKVNPDLDPETSVFFTPAGRGWVDSLTKTASLPTAAYFHASPDALPVGTVLVPHPDERFPQAHPERVYFSPDPWVALMHHGGAIHYLDGRTYLYRVQPHGPVEDDPEAVAVGKTGQSYMAASATILAEVSVEEFAAMEGLSLDGWQRTAAKTAPNPFGNDQLLLWGQRTALHDVQGDIYLMTDNDALMDLVLDLSEREFIEVSLWEQDDLVHCMIDAENFSVVTRWADDKVFVSAHTPDEQTFSELDDLRESLGLADSLARESDEENGS